MTRERWMKLHHPGPSAAPIRRVSDAPMIESPMIESPMFPYIMVALVSIVAFEYALIIWAANQEVDEACGPALREPCLTEPVERISAK